MEPLPKDCVSVLAIANKVDEIVRFLSRDKDTGNDLPLSFELFWEIWPRKEAKKKAFVAWKKLNPSELLVNHILDAVRLNKQREGWLKDGGMFIPLPASWLNGERWDDKFEVGKVSGEIKRCQNIRCSKEGPATRGPDDSGQKYYLCPAHGGKGC